MELENQLKMPVCELQEPKEWTEENAGEESK